MKRLRDKYGAGIRSFGCAEYGEKNDRPHYHILLFNHDFDDKEELTKRGGYQLYKSKELAKLWGLGHCVIGSVEFESAGYVARYMTKKYTGPMAPLHYWDGEIRRGRAHIRRPEGTVCLSRMPGIGRPYFEKWMSDMYPRDQVVIREKIMKPPKYYDSLFSVVNPEEFRKMKLKRKWTCTEAQEKAEMEYLDHFEKTGRGTIHDRVIALEECLQQKTKTLIRGYENVSQGVHSLRFEG